ncbi:hypothetical protein PN487_00710, partial [Microcystis aeruginosa CS-556/03]|nr:hypothetical protein [Microcystis aeruginosa CS-556/03]
GINLGEDSVLGFHLVGILAFSLSTQIFFFLATLVLSGFDPLVSVSQPNHSNGRHFFREKKSKSLIQQGF